MERPEPQRMLGLRVMAKKGLDAYLTAGFLHFSITFDGKKLHFSMINVKTTLLKLWRYYVKYRVLKRHFL